MLSISHTSEQRRHRVGRLASTSRYGNRASSGRTRGRTCALLLLLLLVGKLREGSTGDEGTATGLDGLATACCRWREQRSRDGDCTGATAANDRSRAACARARWHALELWWLRLLLRTVRVQRTWPGRRSRRIRGTRRASHRQRAPRVRVRQVANQARRVGRTALLLLDETVLATGASNRIEFGDNRSRGFDVGEDDRAAGVEVFLFFFAEVCLKMENI